MHVPQQYWLVRRRSSVMSLCVIYCYFGCTPEASDFHTTPRGCDMLYQVRFKCMASIFCTYTPWSWSHVLCSEEGKNSNFTSFHSQLNEGEWTRRVMNKNSALYKMPRLLQLRAFNILVAGTELKPFRSKVLQQLCQWVTHMEINCMLGESTATARE